MGNEPEKEGLEVLPDDERDAKLRKINKRALGNVEFIGELFKLNMVGVDDLIVSLDKLMGEIKTDHEKIQPLCKLLDGIGEMLEDKNKAALDRYFAVFEEMAQTANLSSRFRFMLLDLKDLRAKGWVARRAAEGPKLLADIKKEVDKENRYTEKKKVVKEKPVKTPKKKEGKDKGGKKKEDEDDGWVTTAVKGKAPAKGNPKSRNVKDGAPSSPMAAVKGGAKPPAKGIAVVRGGFAALMDDDDDDDDESDDDDDDEEESEEDGEEEEEEEEAEEEVEEPAVRVKHGPELDEEAGNKVGFILEEFMCSHDVEEAVQCMVELHQMTKYSKAVLDEEVVRRGLCMALENSPKECTLMAKMFAGLIEQEILQPEDASRGFCDIFQDLPDISIDIPKAPELLASIARDMLRDEMLTKDVISKGVKELLDSNEHMSKYFEEIQSVCK
jgi:hypothetical protein